jgi:hypothetical protein
MEAYDPLKPPDPKAWLELDESERIELVADYHRKARIRLPNLQVHATFHVIVENQVALGEEIPVRRNLERLIKEGVDRHEALHAVASLLTDLVFAVSKGKPMKGDPTAAYYAKLEKLTIAKWRRDHG